MCGKAHTKAPRCFARLDPVFARDTSGCSIFYFVKEELTRIAIASPFCKRNNEKRVSLGRNIIATCPSPAPEHANRVYGPSFVV